MQMTAKTSNGLLSDRQMVLLSILVCVCLCLFFFIYVFVGLYMYVFLFCFVLFFVTHLCCLVECLSMIVWTHAVLGVLYACVFYFCSRACSAQLSIFLMERCSRNTLIVIVIIVIIIIIIVMDRALLHLTPLLWTLLNRCTSPLWPCWRSVLAIVVVLCRW